MILFIILTLIFKSSLSMLDPPPYITTVHVSDVDAEELIEVFEEEASSTHPVPSSSASHSKVVHEATKNDYGTVIEEDELVEATNKESDTKAECQVYEEIIGQIFELVEARNSTSGYQYRLLRDTIDDLHLFDICYELACVAGQGRSTRPRGGRFFHDKDLDLQLHVDKAKAKPKKKVYVDTRNDRDFCRKSDFCRTCPYSSSCCNDWCWKTCYDEDIRNPNYCNLWRSSDLCNKINHCQCNLDHGDCFGGGSVKKYHGSGSSKSKHSSSGSWSTWADQDGWDGNDRPSEYFGSDSMGWRRDRYRGGSRGRTRYRGGGRPRDRYRGGSRGRYDDYDYGRYDRYYDRYEYDAYY